MCQDGSLYPYQRDVLAWALTRKNVALFLEMRLGKTRIAINWAESVCPTMPKLVVAPFSVIAGWEDELTRLDLDYLTLASNVQLAKSIDPYNIKPKWILVNYETLTRAKELLIYHYYGAIILDESPRIKSPRSAISKLLTTDSKATYRAILSGCPAPEDMTDYFQQFKFLNGHFLGYRNYFGFRDRYYEMYGYDWLPKKGTFDDISNEVRARSYILSRKDVGIGSVKIYQRRSLLMSWDLECTYLKAVKEYVIGNDETKWAIVLNTMLRKLLGGIYPEHEHNIKVNELVDLLDTDLVDQKVIVWAWYRDEIDRIKRKITNREVLVITGDTSREDRRRYVRQFQKDKTNYVMLAQVATGKYGLDMSAASTAIYYSNSYSSDDRIQSEDRIIHPEKKESTLIIDLVFRDTVEDYLIDLLHTKKLSSKAVLRNIFQRLRANL